MSLTGRLPLLVLVGVVPLLLRPQTGTAWWWLIAVALLVAIDLLAAPSPRRLRLLRRPTSRTRLGEPTSADVEVGNPTRRRVRGVLRDAWQPSAGGVDTRHRLRLAPGEQTLLSTTLVPRRRGTRRVEAVTVRLRGPLGLACRQRSLPLPGTVRVVPAFPSRRLLPSRLQRLRELDGRSAVRVRGSGTEFDSLREYVRGDDVRAIDWRASARSRTTVVRTWQPERDRRVVIVVDTGRTSAARLGDVPRLDAAMDAALLLTALAARAGDRVDLVAGDRGVRARVRGSHSRAALEPVEEALTDLEPVLAEADWDRLVGGIESLGRQRALVVLLTPLDPAAVGALLPRLAGLGRRHRVVLASARDPELAALSTRRDDREAVYAAAAAEHGLSARADVRRVVERMGVHVVDEDTDRLPAALSDLYLSLKARGLL